MPKKPISQPVNQTAAGNENIQVAGSNNIVTQIKNFFAGDAETTQQRNRRIMLGHVETFWVKGILEKSIDGAALLELSIKEDSGVLNYPLAIKREVSRGALPPGMSMLEIFEKIGMGRSLLILGAPGSGKTTMLLELTRQLIERAREDLIEPIPVVFNLSSWTNRLTLANWLVREINTIYSVPRKIASTWIEENKILLLLDGLDEVSQENRANCVDAINQFRRENGLTSLVVCSRAQDYADLKKHLSFDGAIEVQPLTLKQVDEYLKRYGKKFTTVRQVLKKDALFGEMAETPLFLSLITFVMKDVKLAEIKISESLEQQRRNLFDAYIDRMFAKLDERSGRQKYRREDVVRWLSLLGRNMVLFNQVPFLVERIQPNWLTKKSQLICYHLVLRIVLGLSIGLVLALVFSWLFVRMEDPEPGSEVMGFITGLSFTGTLLLVFPMDEINTIDYLTWSFQRALKWLIASVGVTILLVKMFEGNWEFGIVVGLTFVVWTGIKVQELVKTIRPGQKILMSLRNSILIFLTFYAIIGLGGGLVAYSSTYPLSQALSLGATFGLIFATMFALGYGLLVPFQHYTLRLLLSIFKRLPFHLVSFLDHAVDLVFIRRVGGGYIFVHRLLMEHFAAMYSEGEKAE